MDTGTQRIINRLKRIGRAGPTAAQAAEGLARFSRMSTPNKQLHDDCKKVSAIIRSVNTPQQLAVARNVLHRFLYKWDGTDPEADALCRALLGTIWRTTKVVGS